MALVEARLSLAQVVMGLRQKRGILETFDCTPRKLQCVLLILVDKSDSKKACIRKNDEN